MGQSEPSASSLIGVKRTSAEIGNQNVEIRINTPAIPTPPCLDVHPFASLLSTALASPFQSGVCGVFVARVVLFSVSLLRL